MTRLLERLRWRIAALVDRLPGQCWADLVVWALGGRYPGAGPWHPWRPITTTCREDAARVGSCYCNKLQREPVTAVPPGMRDAIRRLWTWLTRCAEPGCFDRPVSLGWCDRHAPAYTPGPDEIWDGRQ